MNMYITKFKIACEVVRIVKNAGLYFRDYCGFIHSKTCVYILKNGVKFVLRAGTNDRVIFNQVWLTRSYAFPGFEIRTNDIVFDIGAHIGLFTVYAARCARLGRVYAFEPVPENFSLLEKNITLNNLENVSLIQKAIGGTNGIRDFILYSGKNTAAHSFAYSNITRDNFMKVIATTLDSFVTEQNISAIHFLKLDCEGAEYEILPSLSKKTLYMIEKIGMEYHNVDGEKNISYVKKFLEDNGFQVTVMTRGDNMLYAIRAPLP